VKRREVRPPKPRRDATIVDRVCPWFRFAARPLPWRTEPRDPYASLVSEIMLQQTQVSRVVERFNAFMVRFPDVAALAAAPESDVLGLWSGLGYYRRARNLLAAAKRVVSDFGGIIPSDLTLLRSLPGVGRYTAGAVSSIVFDRPAAIVDGNVARVLMRIEGKEFAHGGAEALSWSWDRATELVRVAASGAPGRAPSIFNEGLMELGATVCTPSRPRCGRCPLSALCIARREGSQERIPRPKPAAPRKVLRCSSAVLLDPRGRVLLEQRPAAGMWGALWQAPTLDGARRGICDLAELLDVDQLQRAGSFTHQTSHREVRFVVWKGRIPARHPARRGRAFVARTDLDSLGLGTAQRRVLEIGFRE
jgi:A/G-specific adenine glycosylase